MYHEGHQQLKELYEQLNTVKTQYFILRYYAKSGPTTEFMFLHRLTCVTLYHIRDLRRFRVQMRGFLKVFLQKAPYAQSFLSVYGFLFYTIPHMLTVPYEPQSKEKIPFCEEIRCNLTKIPTMQS